MNKKSVTDKESNIEINVFETNTKEDGADVEMIAKTSSNICDVVNNNYVLKEIFSAEDNDVLTSGGANSVLNKIEIDYDAAQHHVFNPYVNCVLTHELIVTIQIYMENQVAAT